MDAMVLSEQERIMEILREEIAQFVHLRAHLPIGREAEDVIDNALTQVHHFNPAIPYVQISEIYTNMMVAEQEK